jgi:3-oxoacyl-[acyl-carrier protein] reductase
MKIAGSGFKGAGMAGVEGRVALVTGAGSAEGIGFACARALARAGARVALTATGPRIHQRRAELGAGHVAYTADLTRADEAAGLVDSVCRDLGPVAILVNNAGMVQQGTETVNSPVEAISDAEWQHHLALNVTTAFNVIRAVLPDMQRHGFGRIVNVASVTGPLVTNPRSAGYSAAKAAMTGLTRAVAIENASRGITCNAVLPGWIATASSSAAEIAAGQASPAGRPGTAEEVAACALFLADAAASYVTGSMLVVDGGNSIVEFKGASRDWY